MAIDTAAKRKSAIGIGLHFLRTGVIPDGLNLNTSQREHVQGLYSRGVSAVSGEYLIAVQLRIVNLLFIQTGQNDNLLFTQVGQND